MAKNTVKKIKELKGEKPTKISNEELNSLQSLINNINQLHMQIGQIESSKHTYLHGLSKLNEDLNLMRDTFKSTYNTDDINISDGTIKYNETN